jgi:chemotaxis protein methyltransferase CheR
MRWRHELAALVQRRTGVEVPAAAPQLSVTLRERIEALQLSGPEAYIHQLERLPQDHPEWHQLIQNVTNHLTYFFRDTEQLTTLVQVLEELASKRGSRQPLRVWSAGCATGEEVYTLAIIAHERGLDLQIHGSDVSQPALEVAKNGIYDAWSLRHVDSKLVDAYFTLISRKAYQVRPALTRRVHFHEHNLIRDPPLSPRGIRWDVIICRNVLIYYSPAAVRGVLAGFEKSLSRDGALLLGASESIMRLDIPLRVRLLAGRVVYYRANAEGFSQAPASARGVAAANTRNRLHTRPEAVSETPERKQANQPDTDREDPPSSYIEVQPELLSMLTEANLDGAHQLLRQVVEHNHADTVACLSLGHVHLLRHDFENARSHYEVVATRDPLIAEAHYFLGVVERRCQQLEAALAALRKAVFLEPRFWAASYLLGATAGRLGKESLRQAEWHRTLVLLETGQGQLPLLTHPLLHAKFLQAPALVLRTCRGSPR